MATAIVWPFQTIWLRDGYGYSRARCSVDLQTRLGRAVLAIGTTGASRFSASLRFSCIDQLGDFEAWVKYVLKAGTLWFLAPVQSSGVIAQREVRFLDISEPVQLVGAKDWRVTASFETRVGTEASLATYTGFGNEDDNLIFGD